MPPATGYAPQCTPTTGSLRVCRDVRPGRRAAWPPPRQNGGYSVAPRQPACVPGVAGRLRLIDRTCRNEHAVACIFLRLTLTISQLFQATLAHPETD